MEFSEDGYNYSTEKAFFNLKKLKNQIAPNQEGDLKDDQVNEISKRLDVNRECHEVVNTMNRRMMGQEKSQMIQSKKVSQMNGKIG